MSGTNGTNGTNDGRRKALVIGGGIAGPVTALALAKAGIDAAVYEAYESAADNVGGLFMVAPNGLDALRTVGVDAEVREIGQPIERMVMEDGRGRTLGAFGGVPGLPPGRVMWRSDLLQVLNQKLREAGIRVEYGKRLVSAEESGHGVTAHFADGSSATADLLIGADGTRSVVRTLIDPDAPGPQYTGLLGLGSYSTHRLPGRSMDSMYFAHGKQAFFGFWPMADGGTAWFSNLPQPEQLTRSQVREIPKEEWLRRLREVHADDLPARDVLREASVELLDCFPRLEIMPTVPHWYRGRMVLVGDSAHAPSNSSGQGVSLAVESAVELARCLRDLPDPAQAFAAYERLRRPRVEKIAADAARTNNQKAAGPVGRVLFRMLAPIAVRTFMRPEKMFGPIHGHRIDWDERVAAA